jgi:chromosome partitioning protein
MSRAAVAGLEELQATGLFLEPLIPERAIVQEGRISGEWYGQYRKGSRVRDAYTAIAKKVLR